MTWLCNGIVRLFVRPQARGHRSDEEIGAVAERGARQGTLSQSESSLITNALALDDVRVGQIMTPRTVVTALRKSATVGELFREHPTIPFARMPVYGRNLDDIGGLVRRRDLLKARPTTRMPSRSRSSCRRSTSSPRPPRSPPRSRCS